jgi:hypothetical protein
MAEYVRNMNREHMVKPEAIQAAFDAINNTRKQYGFNPENFFYALNKEDGSKDGSNNVALNISHDPDYPDSQIGGQIPGVLSQDYEAFGEEREFWKSYWEKELKEMAVPSFVEIEFDYQPEIVESDMGGCLEHTNATVVKENTKIGFMFKYPTGPVLLEEFKNQFESFIDSFFGFCDTYIEKAKIKHQEQKEREKAYHENF